jgi:hypothetical protein
VKYFATAPTTGRGPTSLGPGKCGKLPAGILLPTSDEHNGGNCRAAKGVVNGNHPNLKETRAIPATNCRNRQVATILS